MLVAFGAAFGIVCIGSTGHPQYRGERSERTASAATARSPATLRHATDAATTATAKAGDAEGEHTTVAVAGAPFFPSFAFLSLIPEWIECEVIEST